MPPPASRLDDLRERLRSRRVQERFFHLRFYEGEAPERSLAAGIELTETALKMRRGAM